ncbi:MAG: trigger factor [Myxococcota bacterium]|nr:trigger factor [Myxococcota bacterium]
MSQNHMQVTVEDISSVEKKVVVEIAADAVKRTLVKQYKRISKTARVRGFRPGKVPMGLVKQMYRGEATEGATRELLQEFYPAAIEETGLSPLTMPEIDQSGISEGEPYHFTLRIQIKPEVSLVGLDQVAITREDAEPTDEELNERLEAMRQEHAELEGVDGAADTGHVLTIDYSGTLKDAEEPFEGGTADGQELEIGSGRFIPGFEDQLIGAAAGDSRTIEVTFPEDYGSEDLAGKEAIFSVTVQAVRQRVVPDLDDELAKDLEFDDLSAMRASVYDKIAENKRQEEQARLRESVINQTLSLNPIDTPRAMVDASLERLESQMRTRFQMQGMQDEWFSQIMEMQRPHMEDSAKKLARTDLVLDAIADEQSLEVDQADLDEKLSEMAGMLQMPLPKLRAELTRSGRIESVRQDMLHDAALEWLIEHAIENAANGVEPYEPPAEAGQLDNGETEVQDSGTPSSEEDGESESASSDEPAVETETEE